MLIPPPIALLESKRAVCSRHGGAEETTPHRRNLMRVQIVPDSAHRPPMSSPPRVCLTSKALWVAASEERRQRCGVVSWCFGRCGLHARSWRYIIPQLDLYLLERPTYCCRLHVKLALFEDFGELALFEDFEETARRNLSSSNRRPWIYARACVLGNARKVRS